MRSLCLGCCMVREVLWDTWDTSFYCSVCGSRNVANPFMEDEDMENQIAPSPVMEVLGRLETVCDVLDQETSHLLQLFEPVLHPESPPPQEATGVKPAAPLSSLEHRIENIIVQAERARDKIIDIKTRCRL